MLAQSPDKHPEAVEVEGMSLAADRGPQPGLLFFAAVIHRSQREIRNNSTAFGILRDLIRDGHGQQTRQHPAGWSTGPAYQAPIFSRHRLGRGTSLGLLRSFLQIGLGELQPIFGWT